MSAEKMSHPRELREAKLFPAVKSWLEGQGYTVHAECWDHDVAAYRDETLVVVELKMSFTRHLYQQCIRAATFANKVYAAVATRPRPTSLARVQSYRFGVLRVGDAVEVITEAPLNPSVVWPDSHRRVLEKLKSARIDPDAIAGAPTMKGVGPAINCAKRVTEYLKTNPKASWRQIYAEVPNHYAHYRSMQGAVSHMVARPPESNPLRASAAP